MKKDRTMTIRLPAEIEAKLKKQAEKETRTFADQVLHYIKLGLEKNT
jgi:predicted DNA-binding protein